jgi:hypothetical protein
MKFVRCSPDAQHISHDLRNNACKSRPKSLLVFEQTSNNSRTNPMSTAIPTAILDAVLAHLALIFLAGTGGNLAAARHAASQMLAAYNAETEEELSLAAEIVSFGFLVLDALCQSADPDLSLNQKLRLRGSAVSLSRESHKSRRKLDQLQRDRRNGNDAQPAESPAPAPETPPAPPKIEQALDAIAPARNPAMPGETIFSKGYRQRQAAKRIAENLKKNQAAHAATLNAAMAATEGAALTG